MAPTRASTSLSPSISSSPTVLVDWMVKIELEAAEALAGLAGEVCRNRGEEVTHRVNNELSTGNSSSNAGASAAMSSSSYLDQDWKKDAELKSKPNSAIRYALPRGSKSRQNLTEAEKESRRLRRVLANRESARQTIRRRQALFDELTKKAADLALESENLKRVKELAEKEYNSLRSTNERLKAQMSEILKSEEEESQEESKSTHVDISTSPSTNYPVFIYNHPSFWQHMWPPIVQPLNFVSADSLQERENPTNINNGPQTPLYLVPYPWIFPLPHHGSGPDLQQDETSPNDNKTEPSVSTEPNPFRFPPYGGGLCPRGKILKPTPLSCDSTSNRRHEPEPEPVCDVKASQLADCEILKEPKNLENVFAAANARKRRKELQMLGRGEKNLRG